MTEKTLDPRIALDFWVTKIRGCERSDLPMALTPPGPDGDLDSADGRRRWSLAVSDDDLSFLKKACRGDAQAELVIHATLYRVLLSFYFGSSASVVAAVGFPPSPPSPVFYTAPLDMDGTLRDAIGLTRAETLECAPYRDYPWDGLRDWMRAPDAGGDIVSFGLVLGDETVADSWLESQTALCLTVPVAAHDREVRLSCGPGCDERLAAQFLRHYVALVRGLQTHLDRPLRRILVLAPAEVERLAEALRGPSPDPDLPASLLVDFKRQAAATPGAVAVVDGDGVLTYRELDESASQLAHFLMDECAVRRGDFIGVALRDSRELIVAILAVLKAGAAYMPIDLRYPVERKALLVKESRAATVIVREPGDLETPAAGVVALSQVADRIARYPKTDPPVAVRADDSIYLVFTSGSTGTPKGVAVEHGAFRNLLAWYMRTVCSEGRPSFLLIAPVSFDLAQKNLFAPLLCGGTLHLLGTALDDYSAKASYIDVHGIDVINCAPSAFYPLLEFGAERRFYPLRSLRHVVLGGEPIDASKLSEWAGSPNFRAAIMNSYGPTEFTDVVTYHKLGAGDLRPDAGAIPIGRPVDGIRLFVLSPERRLCAPHMVGELYLGGAGLSKGYINAPEEQAKRFVRLELSETDVDGVLYRTGDLVRWDGEARLEYLGRADDQVKINGFRIESGEVERAVRRLDDVEDVVVCPKTVRGENVLVAYFIAGRPLDPQAMRRRVAESLPPFAVPTYFCQRTSFPRTPSGKLDKQALPAPGGDDLRGAFQAPATPVEERLSRVWAGLLDVERVGRSDDFFALGGHSLTAVRLVSHVARDFGVELSLNTVFEHSRLDDLAQAVSAADPSRFAGIPRLASADDYELSSAQRRLWLASQFETASQAYNLHATYEVRGEVAPERLESAILQVIGKHESLRTVFRTGPDGNVRQVIRPAALVGFHIEHVSLSRGAVGGLDDYLGEFVARPFDLAGGPLLRAALVEGEGGNHTLAFAVHHSICDAWSLGVFVSDLLKFYDHALAGPPAAQLEVQYKDYAAWQRDRLESGCRDAHRRFWLESLAGIETVSPVDLPGCRARPRVKTYRGAVVEHAFSAPFVSRLEELGARRGCTLFMVLMAGLKATLFRQTGQPDITLGTAVAGRDHIDLEQQIGFYVNTLPLRTTLSAEQTFDEFLARVKVGATAALEHQGYPFDSIVDDLELRRDPGRSPVFDLLVVLQNATENQALNHIEGPAFRLTRRSAPQRFSKFDATFNFSDRGPGARLGLEVEYNTDLYDEGAVRRFIGALETLLAEACDDAARPLGHLRCLPAAEREVVLNEFSRGRADPAYTPFLAQFAARCAVSAADAALLFEDRTVSYAELDVRSDQFAGFLIREMGVRPGDRVAVRHERDDWLVVALIGVLKAGAAFVPLDPAYPARRIEFVLGDCDCRVVVDAPLVRRFRAGLGSWPVPLAAEPSPAAVAYLIYTSGSTGEPKGVQITHDNLAAFLLWCLREFASTDIGVVFAATSICFDLSIFELFFSLSAGKTIRLIESPAHIGEWLGAHRRILLNTVPSVILELCHSGHDLTNVTAINVAGEPASPALREVLDYRRTEVRNLYGPSEDTTYSTVHRLDDRIGAVPIGRPIDNTRVYVLDPALRPVGIGVAGEVYLSGRGVCQGYINRPWLNEELFLEHPAFPGERLYRTGDHARWMPDGNLMFLGRRDAQVKVRGRRIELGEIEVELQRIPGVRQAAILIRGDGSAAELEAYYVGDEWAPGPPAAPPEPDAVRSALAASLPGYMVPAAIVRLGELPLTPNGKVDRRALLSRSAPGRAGASRAAAPRSELEERILAVWQSVIEAPGAGIDHSYFDLGGDSLRAMTIITRLNEELGRELRISDLYHHPTVRELGAEIQRRQASPVDREPGAAPARGASAPSAAAEYPITPAQAGLYYLQRLDSRSTAYNIPLSFAVRGPLDAERLQAAVDELVQRHDAFRTRFDIRNRTVVGLVEPAAELPVVRQKIERGEEAEVLRGFVRPFDLSRAPLARVKLASRSDTEHYVVIDVHHLVFDGASVALLLNELARLYRGGMPTTATGLRYADHALLVEQEAADERTAQRAYWLEKLGGDRTALALPYDFPKGKVQRFSGDYVELWIGPEQRQRVHSLARAAGTTVFSALFSLFAGALSHICRQSAITMGIPVECRRDPRIRDTIGMFVNTLAVRVEVDRARPLEDLLAAHGTELFAALDHQEYPFETLVRELGVQEDGGHNPLFEAMFAYYPRLPIEDVLLGDQLVLDRYRVDRPRISKFPLTFLADEMEDGLRVSLNYDSSLFKRETAEAMGDVVRAVFGLVEAPSTSLSALPPF